MRSFSFFDAKKHDWNAEPGEFNILVGSSSAKNRTAVEIYTQANRADVQGALRRATVLSGVAGALKEPQPGLRHIIKRRPHYNR